MFRHRTRQSIVRQQTRSSRGSIFEPLESRQLMSGVPTNPQDLGTLTGRTSVSDNVSVNQSVDSYRLQLPAPGTMSLQISGLTADANLHLLDSGGTEIGTSAIGGTSSDQITTGQLAAGTYFVQVDLANTAAGSASTNYNLQLTADKAGNTIGTARDLGDLAVATTKTINDFVGGTDVDFYKFTLSSTRRVDALMNNLTANADLQFIVDAVNPGVVDTGEVILQSTNAGTNFDEVTPTYGPGTYFLRVVPIGAAQTNYTLNINSTPGGTPDDHGGDSLSTPRAIGTLGAATQTFVDFVGNADGADVYRFDLAHLSRVDLKLDGLTDNADLQLVTAPAPNFFPETLVSSSVNNNALSEEIQQTVAAGTYFLRVQHVTGDTFYRLQMSVTEEDGAGDTLATARDLGTLTSRSFNERVGGPDTDDFYKFNLNAFKHVSINVNGLTTADVDLQLLDASGQVLTTSAHAGATAESIVQNLVPGTYFVHVTPKIGEGPYHIAFTVTAGPDGGGNTLAAATNLGSLSHGADRTLSDYVGPDDVRDTFKFTLSNGSRVTPTFTTPSSGISMFIVQDRNGNGLIEDSEKFFGGSNLVPGTYFLRVQNNNSTGKKYGVDLKVTDIGDGTGDNSRANAFNVGTVVEGNANQEFGDYVGTDDTKDFYKFNVDAFSTINITLDHLVGNADLTLFDANGNVITSSSHSGTTGESVSSFQLFGGTFFARVSSVGSANTTYRIAFAG